MKLVYYIEILSSNVTSAGNISIIIIDIQFIKKLFFKINYINGMRYKLFYF